MAETWRKLEASMYSSPNGLVALGILAVGVEAGIDGRAICSTFMPLEIFEVHFNCTGSLTLAAARGCFARLCSHRGAVRIFGLGVHFFAAGTRESSHFGGLKPTLSGRWR